MKGQDAEVIALVAQNHSKITRKPLRKIKFPKGAIIGAITRYGSVFVPVGDSYIQPLDKAVVFALPKAVAQVEKMFGQ